MQEFEHAVQERAGEIPAAASRRKEGSVIEEVVLSNGSLLQLSLRSSASHNPR